MKFLDKVYWITWVWCTKNTLLADMGLTNQDVERMDQQIWAFAQWLCAQKCHNCLKMTREANDVHIKHTLGTKMYLEICANYVDIF